MIIAFKLGAIALALLVALNALWRWGSRRRQLPCPTWLAWGLRGDLADWILGTSTTLERMKLRPGLEVLEVGPGPGRLAVPTAERVGPTGRVVGLDVQEGMVERLRKRAAEEGITNLQGVVGDGSRACFPPESFDQIFIALTLGEIPAREEALRQCHEVLRPGGRLSVTELFPDPHFLSRRTVRELAEAAGFEHEATTGHALFFTTNFLKPSPVPMSDRETDPPGPMTPLMAALRERHPKVTRSTKDQDPAAAQTLDVRVAGVVCDNDAARLQISVGGLPGVLSVEVWPSSARLRASFDPATTSSEQLRSRLAELGHPVAERHQGPVPPWRNVRVVMSLISGALLLGGWLLSMGGLPGWLVIATYVLAMVVGGFDFALEGLGELVRERRIGIELLMSVAAVGAAALGEVGEGAMLVFLYSISEAAEGYTSDKTRSAVRALMDLAPKTARVREDDEERLVPVEELRVGSIFIVLPGESIATDGIIVSGHSSVDESPVTGESIPVSRAEGEEVLAGTLNGEGALEVRATKTFEDNTLARIVQMVEEAQERKGVTHRFVERFGRRYSPVVLAAGIAVAVLPPLFTGAEWSEWIARAVVLIVAAAPCALVISIPIAQVASLGTAARHGVLIKGGVYLEELAKVRVLALDKTGTLTRGQPRVTDIVPLGDARLSEAELLALASGVETRSDHPLARAILSAAKERGVEPTPTTEARSLTGAGVTATRQEDGASLFVGSASFFEQELGVDLAPLATTVDELRNQGKTVVLVGGEHDAWGLIAIRDELRPGVATVLRALRRKRIERLVMLTGDHERTAEAIAQEAGLDEVHARLKPEDKSALVRRLHEEHGHVAMVGDGVNDAPALASATVGIAMGAAGTDVALETADVALMADDLGKLTYAFELAHANARIVRQNLVLSAVVISVLVVGAVSGLLTISIAIIAHELSELAVIGNGLRMLGVRPMALDSGAVHAARPRALKHPTKEEHND